MIKRYRNSSGDFAVVRLQRLHCWIAVAVFSALAIYGQGNEASIQGRVVDSSGAVIPGASITVTNMDTSLQRVVNSNSAGLYLVPDLPSGRYRVQVSLTGFQTNIRENLELVVGQQLVLNLPLQVGEVSQQVTVTGEAPVVNTSVAQVSGLVGEREVKDLPLNGRSFDNLITLNPGTVNTSTVKQVGAISSSTGPGNQFSVGGRRPGENVFLWNGIEFPGGSGADSGTPGGVSGQLLGIDAVKEFNVVANIDSAEYGHREGAQISVVTASGTNSFHGSMFEFLRNSDLDARNFFDHGSIPPFKRSQFGGSAGGPIRKDKTFVFGNYEGFRQRLGLSIVGVVPDEQARAGKVPDANGVYQTVPGLNPAVLPYFGFWPAPNGGELLTKAGLPTGTALNYSNPPSPIQEDFGVVRADHNFSDRDTLSGSYTIDSGNSISTPATNSLSTLIAAIRTQVVTLTETHIFSPNIVNTFTAGYSRPNLSVLNLTTVVPSGTAPLVLGYPPPRIVIGGGTAGASSIAVAGSVANGSAQTEVINTFTYQDQLHITKGLHSLTAGVWFSRLRWDETENQFGQVAFPDLTSFLQGMPSNMVVEPHPGLQPWRVFEGAWFVQDSIKVRPNLTLSLGVRHEFTNGFINAAGQAANFLPGPNGILMTQPRIASTLLTTNNSKWLFSPRAGLSWDPLGDGKMSVRAGFGIAHNLLDNMGWCCKATFPLFATYQILNPTFPYQLNPAVGFAPGLNVVQGSSGGGGIQPNAQTPAVVNYRLEIERELTPGTSVRVAYIGAHGYHEFQRSDANLAIPVICAAAQGNCPAGLADGTKYFPAGDPRRNPQLGSFVQFFTSAFNRYNGASVDLNHRFRGGLAFRTNYTYAKSMDNASSLTSSQALGNNAVALDNYDRRRDYGLSVFDVRHRFNFSGSYELPFGAGKPFLGGAKGATGKLVSGWRLNVIAGVQGGFPFTPQLGFNQSRDGDTSTPDRPSMAPGRTLKGIYLNNPLQWYDPTAFALPLAGTYGNVGRNTLIGPGLQDVDFSLFKTTRLSERWNLQFRAEFFNLFNHANFGLPSVTVLTPSGAPSSSAGLVSMTTTTSRQIQFGLKLNW